MKPRNPVAVAMAKNPSRALRRHADRRAKAQTRAKLALTTYATLTPRMVGKAAAVHCRGCSCWMCSDVYGDLPQKFKGITTHDERYAYLDYTPANILAEEEEEAQALYEEHCSTDREDYDYAWSDYCNRGYDGSDDDCYPEDAYVREPDPFRFVKGMPDNTLLWENTGPDTWVLTRVWHDYYDQFDEVESEFPEAIVTIDRDRELWVVSNRRDEPTIELPYYELTLDAVHAYVVACVKLRNQGEL